MMRCAKASACMAVTIHENSDCAPCIHYNATCDHAVSAIASMMARANHNRGEKGTVGGARVCNPGIATVFVKATEDDLQYDGDVIDMDDNSKIGKNESARDDEVVQLGTREATPA